jgi:CheY-like chemotaxis protein
MSTQPLAFVIEDDEDLSVIFSGSLSSAGYETETFRDGQRALERLAGSQPKLVVLDLHLPGVNGLDILKKIRAEQHLADVKVIIATADPRMAEFIEDADFVLIKPISFSMLRELSSRLL